MDQELELVVRKGVEAFKTELGWFIADAEEQIQNRAWIYTSIGSIYVRSLNFEGLKRITLATVSIDEEFRGKGALKDVLTFMETQCSTRRYSLLVENVIEPRFAQFLKQRRYTEIPSFLGLSSWIRFGDHHLTS